MNINNSNKNLDETCGNIYKSICLINTFAATYSIIMMIYGMYDGFNQLYDDMFLAYPNYVP